GPDRFERLPVRDDQEVGDRAVGTAKNPRAGIARGLPVVGKPRPVEIRFVLVRSSGRHPSMPQPGDHWFTFPFSETPLNVCYQVTLIYTRSMPFAFGRPSGSRALDLVNTLDWRDDPARRVELLPTTEALA